MIMKDYMGRCGSCMYCDLSNSYRAVYTTTFHCTRNNYSVQADEKACNRFEPAKGRSNEIIAKYDK